MAFAVISLKQYAQRDEAQVSQEAVDSGGANAQRLSSDAHLNRLQQRLSIDALVVLHPKRNNHIILNEEVERQDTSIEPNSDSVPDDDEEDILPIPVSSRVYIPDPSLPAEVELLVREDYFNDDIAGLQQQGMLRPEPIPMPMGKEYAIIEILRSVISGVDELEPCFCGDLYEDNTVKTGKDSHEAVKMPGCYHIFGKRCIVQWLNETNPPTCPMCRKRVHLTMNVPVERRDDQELYRVIDYHYAVLDDKR
ncbi:hypothetical protein SBOR_5642 [Sclerotinia borealis F-4128]|uniref:Anaphase-promoting complex subunit 11 n=1 Tax=Sclerotinia borealis (strain F-4128) TaxID=1432307 RepID=W9CB56_SCLBF|nr:hypothetical protein SBOR_5642 [Sclerotinia borealis F-4128]